MYKIILAVRYLIRRRITYLAVVAVALCVFMVVVVMTVMTGLVQDFKIKNHNWVGDCVVRSESLVGFPYYEEFIGMLEREDFIETVSPVIKSYGILSYEGSEWNDGVEVLGIEPVRHNAVSGFGRTLYYRKDDVSKAFNPVYEPNLAGIILGIDMLVGRDEFGRYKHREEIPAVSFAVSCFPLTAGGGLAKGGLGLVNTKTFYYSDNSHSGLAKEDGTFVYLAFEEAQVLCGMGGANKRANAIHIKFKPNVRLQTGCDKVSRLWDEFVAERGERTGANLLSKVKVESWKGYKREVIAGVEKEQMVMMAVFVLIGIITVFIVFVIFYMIVSHKSKDIGILKSIGGRNSDIVSLFLYFAFFVGVLGSATGTAGGVLFLAKINDIEKWLYDKYGFQLWNRMLYAIDEIPNKIEFNTLAIIIACAILACLIGALIPSRQAARLKPVETLQVSQL